MQKSKEKSTFSEDITRDEIKRLKIEQPAKQKIISSIINKIKSKDGSILQDDEGGYFWTSHVLKDINLSELLSEIKPYWCDMIPLLRHHPILTVINKFIASVDIKEAKKGNWVKKEKQNNDAIQKRDSKIAQSLEAIIQETRDMLRDRKGNIVIPIYPDYCIVAFSGFIETISGLLRNDSLVDISSRYQVCHNFFSSFFFFFKKIQKKKKNTAISQRL